MSSCKLRAGRPAVVVVAALAAIACCSCALPRRAVLPAWDDPALWSLAHNPETSARLGPAPVDSGGAVELAYTLGGGHGWVELTKDLETPPPSGTPITLRLRVDGTGDLEIKMLDADGSVYGRKIAITPELRKWTPFTLYPESTDYWWGGDDLLGGLTRFQLAVSGQGAGTLWLADAGFGEPGAPATLSPVGPALDPDRELPGIGFRQRRADALIPEDPLILEWLKLMQDLSSPERQLVPSMENNEAHTFNNALVAMAFLVKGERERAERILDFYAAATKRDNTDPTLQNFFFNGEARGFFQAVALRAEDKTAAYHTFRPNDRWMGDMAWLLMAYKHHEQIHGPERYAEVRTLIQDLLTDWFCTAPDGSGGFVQHGWRQGDAKLHEPFGHPEGNIDAYAVFRLCGDHARAEQIKTWIDRVLKGRSMPLDLYTWRTLAFGPSYAHLLDIPDYDLRYRKTIIVNGQQVMGLLDHADIAVTNIWFDGVGHIACAYQHAGLRERGWFYANQLDPFIITRTINGTTTHAIPYVANATGNDWVELDKGFVSVAAWYIFAKNGFNPMTLKYAP